MALTRYQIRNEYGLADKELYQGGNKDDPEALLEGASMAGLVGVLRQLGDLAEFAAEVFNCLHEQLMTTAARGDGLRMRLQQLEAELPPILSQTHHSTFFYDSGLEWHSYLQTEQNLITPRSLPPFILDSYEECRAPPQLFLLDKFDVAGSGSCLKRYSDPSLLKTSAASSLVVISKLSKDERPRRPKKKGLHTTSKETHGDSRTSHAKLHQLFSLEHVENAPRNPELHVKLKRRLLKAPINSSSGTCYMEKFLKNSSPFCERVHGTLDQSSPAMQTQVTVCSVQEDLPIPCLVYPNNEDTRKYNESTAADDERLEIPFVPQEITVSEKSLPNVEGGPAISLDRSSSVNLSCKVNNDTNAPASTESEAKEASEVFKVGRDPMLIISHETFPGYLSELTQLPHDASEGGTKVLLTNYVDDDHSQHVSSVETVSEMSLSALVENQFSSLTNQEKEALEPEVISSEAGHSTLDSKSNFKETPAPLESVFPLPNQYISTSDNLEDLSLAAAAQDNVVLEEDETNSQDEQSGHISTSEFCSENGTLKSASSCREDTWANPDLAEILSYPGQEDPQIMPIVTDDSYEPEVPIPDTQRHGTCFVGDVDHENQTGLNNKANETVPEIDLENISYPQESLLSTCLSPEHCIQTQGQGLESPPETGSPSITALAESLPTQDGAVGVQGSPAEEALTCNEKLFPSSITKIEALDAAHQETFTSLNDHIYESVLSMDLTGEEDGLDVSPESMSLHETHLADPEITPPLPPLPPTEWWMGKLVESTENTHNGSVQASEAQYPSEASVTAGGNHNYGVYTEESRMEAVSSCAQTTLSEPSKATEEHSPSTANGTSDTYMESTPKRLKKAAEESFFSAETAQGLEADWRTEAMALEWFSQNLREHTNPDPGKLEEEQTQLDHSPEPTGETKIPQTLRNNSSYDQNEKVGKVSRDEDSLVIGIDRSMLRKVSERNRTHVGARVDENNSLLEIIRSKSFNLRPTEASVRPNFQVAVPKTNLKVAAILEKANTFRQAMAGSDDDHDSDSWSE